jgi:hypothetical protein
LLTWLAVSDTFSSPPGEGEADEADPVSWLQIQPGWKVVASGGEPVGSVLTVAGDKQDDIFNGLAIGGEDAARPLYVPGEKVGRIVPGQVTLRLSAAEASGLAPFQQPPTETVWRPEKPSLTTRLSNWLRGRR